MRIKESNCVGCRSIGLHCMGSACPNSEPSEYIVCDECGDTFDSIYIFNGRELCTNCIIESLGLECVN